MIAVLFWVRTIVRRRVGATIAIALLAGGVAGVVGVALQASRRAEGAVQRYEQRNRSYELGVVGCRPGVGPTDDSIDFQQVLDGCLSMPAIEEFRADVLSGVPGIEGQAAQGARVLGILDPSSPNGWGRLILAHTTLEVDVGGALDAPLLVAGRRLDENAPDEVMIVSRSTPSWGARSTAACHSRSSSNSRRASTGRRPSIQSSKPFRVRLG